MSTLTNDQQVLFDYVKGRLKVPFNEGQEKLLHPIEEPILSFAVPGSGKTNTLTAKVWMLELIQGIAGQHIWVVTFTKKAAREFSKRHDLFGKRIDPNLQSKVNIKTIHAMCYSYVNTFHIECGLGSFNMMSEEKARLTLKDVIAPIRKVKPHVITNTEVNNLLTAMSWFDNRLLFEREEIIKTLEFKSLRIKWEEYKSIYDTFKYVMKSSGNLTQDEVMMKFLQLLQTNNNVLDVVRKGIRYICVDEFQDTTPLQYEIIKLMKSPDTGMTVVGDSDQSIYRWRGATNIIFNFMKDFPNHVKIGMDINYRCPDKVIDCANALIGNNSLRIPVEAKGTGKEGKVTIIPCKSNKQASLEIGNRIISEYLQSNRDNHTLIDKLVLYRNHSQAMFLLYMLASNEVPVNVGGASLPHKDKIVRDLHNIILMLKNPRDSNLAHEYMRMLSSQIRKTKKENCPFFNSAPTEHFAKVPVNVKDINLYKAELTELLQVSAMIAEDKPAVEIFKRLVPMYMNNYYMKSKIYEYMGKTEDDVNAIVSFLYTAVPDDYTYSQFMFTMNKSEQFLNEQKNTFVGLDVYSMHGAKGLEADTVYILDSNGKTNPSSTKINSLMDNKAYAECEDYINEERSLFFVAITRAKKELIMTYNENSPSPFNLESGLHRDLVDLPERLSLKTLGVNDFEIQRAHNKLLGKEEVDLTPTWNTNTTINNHQPKEQGVANARQMSQELNNPHQMWNTSKPVQHQAPIQQPVPVQHQSAVATFNGAPPAPPIGMGGSNMTPPPPISNLAPQAPQVPQAPQAPQIAPNGRPEARAMFQDAMSRYNERTEIMKQQGTQLFKQQLDGAFDDLNKSIQEVSERPQGNVNNVFNKN